MTAIHFLTADDVAALKAALKSAGIKARVRRFDYSARVCLDDNNTAEVRAAVAVAARAAGFGGVLGGSICWSDYQAPLYRVA